MFKILFIIALAILLYQLLIVIPYENDKKACNIYAIQFVNSYLEEYTWCMNNRDKWK